MSPNVFGHTYTIRLLFVALFTFATEHDLGEVFSESTFVLPDQENPNWVRGSRIPDVIFISKSRLETYMAETEGWRDKPLLLVPDLVVEVVSPTDSYSEIDDKITRYKKDGVRLIWVVDPQRKKISVHTLESDQQINLVGNAILTGGDVLPGFELSLKEIFG